MDIGILNAVFKADVAEFVRDVGKAANAMEKTQRQIEGAIKGINRAMGAVGAATGGFITATVFKRVIDEASQAESAAKKVDAIIRATGGAAGVTAKYVDDLANSYSKLTGTDDEVIKGGEAMLLTFKGIGKDVFPRATAAMLDMAEAMGTDVKSASITLGKALDNPTKGLAALQKQGLGFSEAQTKVIKSMQQTGHLADAQREILKALEGQIGGVAVAARDTLAGALKALDTSFGNLLQTIGEMGALDLFRTGVEALVIGLDTLNQELQKPIVKQFLSDMAAGFEIAWEWSKPLIDALGKILDLMGSMDKLRSAAASGKAKDLLPAILGFGTNVAGLGQENHSYSDKIQKFFDDITKRSAASGKASGKNFAQAMADQFSDPKVQKDIDKALSEMLKKIKAPSAYDFVEELHKRKLQGEQPTDPAVAASIRRGAGLKDLYSELDALDLEFDKKSALAKLDGDAVIRLEAREKAHKAFPLDLEAETNAYNRLYEAMARNQALESETEWKKKVEGIHEETEALKAKVEGREEEYKLLKAIREIEKDPYLSPQKKLEMAGAISKELDAQKKLNDQYDAQKDLLKKISDGAESYRTKVKELDDAVQKHLLTQKQANDALKDLNNNQLKKFQSGFKSFTNSLLNDLTQVFTGGKKVNDVLKDMGMRVAQLAAQKLLLDPIANALTNYASKLYGGTLAQPGGGTPGTILAGGLGGMLSKLFRKPGTTGGFAPITGNGQSTTANSSTPGILTAGGLAPGVALTGSYDALGRIDSFVTGAQVMTVEGLALRVKIAREPIKPLTAGERKLLSGGGGGSGPVEEDPVVKYLRRFEGQSKGGPAWRVIEPDCPCPTISQLFPKATGTGSASAGSSGDVNFNSDEMQPLTALLGLTGLAGILSALKGGDSAGHLESLVGGLATVLQEISNKLSSILGAMCPCLPPPSCACGPGGGGSPGGYAGGGPGVPGSLPFGAPDNRINEAARAAHAAQANAAQAALFAKAQPDGNAYLSPDQTATYLKGLADKSNAQMNGYYQQGIASYGQVQNLQGAWQNAILTQGAKRYSATPNWLQGLNGGSFQFPGGTALSGSVSYDDYEDPAPSLFNGHSYNPYTLQQGGPFRNVTSEPALWERIGYESFGRNVGSGIWESMHPEVLSGQVLSGGRGSTGQLGATATIHQQTSQNRPTMSRNMLPAINQQLLDYWADVAKKNGIPIPPYGGIPRRGTGGPAGPDGPVFVGDRGTELFMPQDPGRVVSNDQIAAALRSGGGAPNVQIHNNGHPIDVHSTDWDGRTLKMAVGSLATALPNDAAFQRASKRTAPPRNG